METDVSNIVIASIGWTLVLTVAVVAAVFAVNNQFSALDRKFEAIDHKIDALDSKFDRKIDNLQNLIMQHIVQRPERQERE